MGFLSLDGLTAVHFLSALLIELRRLEPRMGFSAHFIQSSYYRNCPNGAAKLKVATYSSENFQIHFARAKEFYISDSFLSGIIS